MKINMKENTQNTDSRKTFAAMTTRKPATWAECARHLHKEMSEEQRDLIRNLPVIGTTAATPMDDFLGDNPPLECVVVITGGQTFYVNSEGYRYARYAFRIIA